MQQTFYFLIKNENENRAKKIKQTKNKTKFLISLNEKLAKLREKNTKCQQQLQKQLKI